MFIVSVIKNGAGSDMRSFARKADAVIMAQQAVKSDADKAMVYAAPDVTDPVKAVTAVETGDAMVMDMISRNDFEQSTSQIVGALQDLVDKNAATKAPDTAAASDSTSAESSVASATPSAQTSAAASAPVLSS